MGALPHSEPPPVATHGFPSVSWAWCCRVAMGLMLWSAFCLGVGGSIACGGCWGCCGCRGQHTEPPLGPPQPLATPSPALRAGLTPHSTRQGARSPEQGAKPAGHPMRMKRRMRRMKKGRQNGRRKAQPSRSERERLRHGRAREREPKSAGQAAPRCQPALINGLPSSSAPAAFLAAAAAPRLPAVGAAC